MSIFGKDNFFDQFKQTWKVNEQKVLENTQSIIELRKEVNNIQNSVESMQTILNEQRYICSEILKRLSNIENEMSHQYLEKERYHQNISNPVHRQVNNQNTAETDRNNYLVANQEDYNINSSVVLTGLELDPHISNTNTRAKRRLESDILSSDLQEPEQDDEQELELSPCLERNRDQHQHQYQHQRQHLQPSMPILEPPTQGVQILVPETVEPGSATLPTNWSIEEKEKELQPPKEKEPYKQNWKDSIHEEMLSLSKIGDELMQKKSQSDLETAIIHFDSCLELIENIKIESIPPSFKNKIAIILCNRSICLGKLNRFLDAEAQCRQVIELDPNWHKGYSTLAALIQANPHSMLTLKEKNKKALEFFQKALDCCTQERDRSKISERIYKLRQRMQMESDNYSYHSQHHSRLPGGMNDAVNDIGMEFNENANITPPKKRRLNQNTNSEERQHALRNQLMQKNNQELAKMLEINQLRKTGTKEVLVERCLDGMINGILPKCPKCDNAVLQYNEQNQLYTCNGYFDPHNKTRCDFQSRNVTRIPWTYY